MESSATVGSLKTHFETIINRTFLAYDLRNCYDAADRDTLRGIEQDVRYMEKALTELKKVIENGRVELEAMHAHTRDMRALSESVRHMLDNVPPCLPRGDSSAEVEAPNHPHRDVLPSRAKESSKENVAPADGHHKGHVVTAAPSSKPASSVPLIPPLTMDEYNDIPKYMLGRITYASLNKTIQDINLTIAEKYRLMKKKQKDKTPQEDQSVNRPTIPQSNPPLTLRSSGIFKRHEDGPTASRVFSRIS